MGTNRMATETHANVSWSDLHPGRAFLTHLALCALVWLGIVLAVGLATYVLVVLAGGIAPGIH